jgi:SulP family sulfate permease
MSRVDAVAFLATAAFVMVNAVLAVAIGCSIYGLKYVFVRLARHESRVPDLQVD